MKKSQNVHTHSNYYLNLLTQDPSKSILYKIVLYGANYLAHKINKIKNQPNKNKK